MDWWPVQSVPHLPQLRRRISDPCNPEQDQAGIASVRETSDTNKWIFMCIFFPLKTFIATIWMCSRSCVPPCQMFTFIVVIGWLDCRVKPLNTFCGQEKLIISNIWFICCHNVIICWIDSYKKNKIVCMLSSTNPTSSNPLAPRLFIQQQQFKTWTYILNDWLTLAE